MKLLFKYPTRARFEWFKQTLHKYYELISAKYPFEFRVTLDVDDVEMNSDKAREFMEGFRFLSYRYGDHKTKIEACNADLDDLNWDILILVSDDMIPNRPGFDIQIVTDMIENFYNTDGCLHYDDGLFGKDQTATLTIMGREYYKRFGYVYHPDYKSFYCDNEYTEVAQALGKIKYIPQVIIKHDWTGGPQSADALYRRNSRMGNGDEAIYKRRLKNGFPK